jgi:hypothetical protein
MAGENANAGKESVTRVEFAFSSGPYPFIRTSEALGCEFDLAEIVPRGGGEYAEFFSVMDADPERILAVGASEDAVDATLLEEFDNGGLFEFLVTGQCPAVTLAEHGAHPRTVRATDGDGRIAAKVPPRHDAEAIIDVFLDENPEGELVCKRDEESFTPMFTESAVRQAFRAHLTDRQREVVRAAFEAGYYEWPRESTGEQVAEELGISSATFSEHIHTAERKLLAVLLNET